MALEEYRRKRDFSRTPEPSGDGTRDAPRAAAASAWEALPHGRRFCVQRHRATRLHFDFRLEHDGVLLSWAVTRGPTLDPAIKRLAVMTEDHPIDYGEFEGVIPSGYGAGTVQLWDIGTFEWVRESAEDFGKSRAKGDLKFRLQGQKLHGEYALVHTGARGAAYGGSRDGERNWLMIKKRDDAVVEGFDANTVDVSVKTGRSLEEIAAEGGGDPREMRRRAAGSRRAQPQAEAAIEPPEKPPSPMLATAVDGPFSREGWLFELKYDGVRALASVSDGRVRLVGRKGRDETDRYPELQAIAGNINAKQAIIDGEIVVLDANGLPSFERLQSRINVGRATDIERVARGSPVVFMAFDVLKLDGRELTRTALRIRKKTLRELIRPAPQLVFVDHVENDGVAFFAELKRAGAEGMLAKRADSLYQPGARTGDWLKVKAWHTQSCAVIGWTAGQGRRGEHLGALILSVLRDGELRHCGQVGTGFTQRLLRDLRRQLEALRSDTPAVDPPPRTGEPATWVRPELVCEVRFAGWTAQGVLRHPAFVRLRPDQTVDDCSPEHEIVVAALLGARANARRGGSARREPAPGSSANAQRTGSSAKEQRRGGSDSGEIDEALVRLRTLHGNAHWEVAGRRLALTNLDKVLWPQDGITKRDMIEYYVRMSAYLLPYLRDRPLSMQVFPDGIDGKSFWRKDKPSHAPKWIDSWTYRGEKTKTYIVVNEVATLGWVANAGVIDLHPWHSRIDAADQPDWAVFDLDPFEPATFHDVIDIAKLVKAALDHYKLHGVIKTSGQTGLQIYVPLRRGPDYTAVRSWVEDVGRAIGQVAPERISWEWEVSRRSGKIRIDYTQNIINKTLAAPYSLRPAAKAPVSTPIAWGELDEPKLRPDGWNIATIADRVAAVGDLFVPVLAGDQPLPASG